MSLITWSDNFSVGVEEIDTQHKKLVQLINDMHVMVGSVGRMAVNGAAHTGASPDNHMLSIDHNEMVMAEILERVIDYTDFHFSTEERLMAEYEFPGSTGHVHEHQRLLAIALELQDKLNDGQARITLETMDFLKKWLSHHILETDKLLGKYLNSQGKY
ncbi:bacteriohemerythrin [Candidatus Methylospira mobilis]|uniref:Bacteriohemerythrin n=1 Tax=Candidatus Methylospira mobilis TaxID=1808979 RepID=A0A5Q0BIC8_9GAMM|nr:bacteriohemerythrin [Candidatus Methylospira mobilis]QFY43590.1 bacteriohemerythrin [Candidatus Methylospira mobilis]WNV03868.1 bacteriohemerythrin [Candidatus Methylospira mobilis]